MAGSYIILIKFTGDTSSMQKMEKDLNGRFSKVSKRFGQGLAKAGKMLKFSAFAAGAMGIVSQLLNPLQEINSALDNILAKSGNIKDQAYAMNTSVGLYAAMQSAAGAKGVDQAQFNMMGQRVMELISQAKSGENDLLKNYTGEKDMGVALYKVVDALKNMGSTPERAAMASQIFGGRMGGRMAGLLDGGFDEPLKGVLKGVDIDKLKNAVMGLDEKGNLQALLRGNMDLKDLIAKNGIITKGTVYAQNRYEKNKLSIENSKTSGYKDIASTQMELDNTQLQFYKLALPVLKGVIPFLQVFSKLADNTVFVTKGLYGISDAIGQRIGAEIKNALKDIAGWWR